MSCVGVGGAYSSTSTSSRLLVVLVLVVGYYQTTKCTHCTSVQVYSNEVEIGIACIGFITGAAR